MLVEHEIAKTVTDKRLTDGVNRLNDMGMMTDDGINPCIGELTSQQTLGEGRHGVELHSPMQHGHNCSFGMLLTIVGNGLNKLFG